MSTSILKANKGIILKIDSQQSNVLMNEKVYRSEIKKSLMRHYRPLVGDRVELDILDDNEKRAIIVNFLPRKSQLRRPEIANVEQVIVVTAVKEPNFNTYLLNKYLAVLEANGLRPILVFTKLDLLDMTKKTDKAIRNQIDAYKELGYEVIEVDNLHFGINTKASLKALENLLQDKISVFVGQTGAGKSTTLNHFLEANQQIKTQEISRALNRGKHTTTNTQLYSLPDNILIADTPGFATFTLDDLTPELLAMNSPLFKPYRTRCKFNNCLHLNENNCAYLNDAIQNNRSAKTHFMYEDYCKMIKELKEKKGNKAQWKKTK